MRDFQLSLIKNFFAHILLNILKLAYWYSSFKLFRSLTARVHCFQSSLYPLGRSHSDKTWDKLGSSIRHAHAQSSFREKKFYLEHVHISCRAQICLMSPWCVTVICTGWIFQAWARHGQFFSNFAPDRLCLNDFKTGPFSC